MSLLYFLAVNIPPLLGTKNESILSPASSLCSDPKALESLNMLYLDVLLDDATISFTLLKFMFFSISGSLMPPAPDV